MRVDPHRLLVLRAVLRAGGVQPAARALFLSPSAVSQHLTRLEAETGFKPRVSVDAGVARLVAWYREWSAAAR